MEQPIICELTQAQREEMRALVDTAILARDAAKRFRAYLEREYKIDGNDGWLFDEQHLVFFKPVNKPEPTDQKDGA